MGLYGFTYCCIRLKFRIGKIFNGDLEYRCEFDGWGWLLYPFILGDR